MLQLLFDIHWMRLYHKHIGKSWNGISIYHSFKDIQDLKFENPVISIIVNSVDLVMYSLDTQSSQIYR